MIVNRNFIGEVVHKFHTVIKQREELCKIARSEHTLEFYKQVAYQELYALRFIPAYYFEYCVLANRLYERTNKDYKHLNIASFGCGLSPDYYALRDNLKNVKFTYKGFDAVEWTSQKHMPAVEKNHEFVHKRVEKINSAELADIDAFIFPKSIGDIRRSGDDVVNTLAAKIAATKKKRLFFLNSYVTRKFNKPLDAKDFLAIHTALTTAGFNCIDDPNETFYKHDGVTTDKPIGLRKIDYEFVYPPDREITCNDQDNADDICKLCIVPKSPIFTNQFMSFQLLEYVKK